MGKSSRRNNKHEKSGEDDRVEGTAARTRPCSFDEIMSRRKNKMLDESEKEKGGLEDVSGDVVAGRSAIERGNNGYDRDSSFNGEKSLREEDVKASSNKKEERWGSIYVKNEKDEAVVKGRERSVRDTRTKLKSIVSRDVGNEVVDRSDEKIPEMRKSDVKRNYSEIELGRKQSRDVVESDKDRRFDGVRGKYERENKRKYRTEVDEKNRESSSTKKHDVTKGHELETSEGRGRKEPSKSHYKESSLKRRLSRSRGRDDMHKRSGSVSPSAEKHVHYHGRGLEHSLKERPGRQHSDIDRNNTIDNGSSTHHHKLGAPTSRLGGYSPRKRRSEAAIKTPSPTKRSPEKKSARWDLAPEGRDGAISASALSNLQASNQHAASRIPVLVAAVPDASATLKLLSGVSPSAVLYKNSSIETVQLTEATRPMRRLYVENIPASASEKTLMEFLNSVLISSGVNCIQGTQPCISCIIHKEKGQALVEFLTPEDATAAMSFDDSFFSGSIIKIRRPKDFIEKATVEPEKSVPAVDVISSVVMDSAHEIFIGGISKVLSSQMLMEIACAFGPLKAYQFDNSKGLTNPCAYLEYADQTVTLKACAGLNGMKLGGQVITAALAVPDASLESSGDPQLFQVPEHAKSLLERPLHVLKLKTMFNPEALPSLSDAEIEEVLEDVRLECVRFGTVKSVNVVKCIASPFPTPGACEVNDDMGSAHAQQTSGCEEPIAKSETCRVAIDHEILSSNITDENKPEDDIMKDEPCRKPGQSGSDMGVQDAAYECPSDGREILTEFCTSEEKLYCSDYTAAKDISQLKEITNCVDDVVAENSRTEEIINHSDGVVVDDVVTENSQMKEIVNETNDVVTDTSHLKETINVESKSRAGEDSDLVEASEELKEVDNTSGMGSDTTATENRESKEEVSYLGHIFEAGSVFVEFARTEASCTAAHCLHGRLFDDRAVVVEYVPLEIYRERFPK